MPGTDLETNDAEYFQKDNIPFKNNSPLSPKVFYSRRQSFSNQREVNNNNYSAKGF